MDLAAERTTDLDVLPWGWEDDAVDTIVAVDVLGDVRLDVARWLDECWRMLRPGGLLIMRLPAWNNPLSYRDPTRSRVFHEETFSPWDPESELHGRLRLDATGRWWTVRQVLRDEDDLRFVLEKRA